MLKRFLSALTFWASGVSGSGVAKADIVATLERMRAFASTWPGVAQAEIDVAEKLLLVTLQNGEEQAVSPDNLDQLLDLLSTEPERDAAVVEFMTAALDVEGKVALDAAALDRLMPYVTSSDLALSDTAVKAGIWSADLVPGLAEYLVIDAPSRVIYVTKDMIDESGLELEALRLRARENLEARSEAASVIEVTSSPWVVIVSIDGYFDCTLLLLPDFWRKLARDQRGLAASCLDRGQLTVVDADDPAALAFLRDYTAAEFGKRPYPGSRSLFRWADPVWVELP